MIEDASVSRRSKRTQITAPLPAKTMSYYDAPAPKGRQIVAPARKPGVSSEMAPSLRRRPDARSSPLGPIRNDEPFRRSRHSRVENGSTGKPETASADLCPCSHAIVIRPFTIQINRLQPFSPNSLTRASYTEIGSQNATCLRTSYSKWIRLPKFPMLLHPAPPNQNWVRFAFLQSPQFSPTFHTLMNNATLSGTSGLPPLYWRSIQ